VAPRVGFSLLALCRLHANACATDARLVWKDGDVMNIGIVQPRYPREDWANYFVQNLSLSGPREMRLLGLQLIAHADEIEADSNPHEVVIP
jgi:hypothetical protein